MVILSKFAFGMSITMDQVKIKGIRGLAAEDVSIADQLGYTVKLIGSTIKNDDTISVEVGPVLVPHEHPLASIHNEMNAVLLKVQELANQCITVLELVHDQRLQALWRI